VRWKIPAGVLLALVFAVPAAPAVAQAAQPGLSESCQTVERKEFRDLRQLVTIDLDTATDTEVRVQANQLMAAATAESLPVLPPAIQKGLDGTPDDLRAFLKKTWQLAWRADLRISVGRTISRAGTNVKAAAQKVLNGDSFDAYLAYLNDGLYVARALDCKSPPTTPPSQPTPSVTPSATTTATPVPSASASQDTGGESGGGGDDAGGLPVTGAGAATVAGIGGALLLLGASGYLIGRRRRSRFVA
jgi:LPXTG-motif cell wall-anchored protein